MEAVEMESSAPGVVLVAGGDEGFVQQARAAIAQTAPELTAMVSPEGRSAAASVVRTLRQGKKLLVVILDPRLPLLGGKGGALAIRSIERAMDVSPAPIIFCSRTPCDKSLQSVMEYAEQTHFIQQREDGDPATLAEVLRKVLST